MHMLTTYNVGDRVLYLDTIPATIEEIDVNVHNSAIGPITQISYIIRFDEEQVSVTEYSTVTYSVARANALDLRWRSDIEYVDSDNVLN